METEESKSLILNTFYRGTVESILSTCIITWFGKWTITDHKTLQWIVKTAEKIIGVSLLCHIHLHHSLHSKKSTITSDPTHPSLQLFTLLPSGRRYRSIRSDCRTVSSLESSDSSTPCQLTWKLHSHIYISEIPELHTLETQLHTLHVRTFA